MKKITAAFILSFAVITTATAQMDLPPSGGNPRATITEEVGITSITIKYSRPDERTGRKIWGTLITYGFTSQNLNTNKNDKPDVPVLMKTTMITFEHDVKVEGKRYQSWYLWLVYGCVSWRKPR
jgi:hypothetical protein